MLGRYTCALGSACLRTHDFALSASFCPVARSAKQNVRAAKPQPRVDSDVSPASVGVFRHAPEPTSHAAPAPGVLVAASSPANLLSEARS